MGVAARGRENAGPGVSRAGGWGWDRGGGLTRGPRNLFREGAERVPVFLRGGRARTEARPAVAPYLSDESSGPVVVGIAGGGEVEFLLSTELGGNAGGDF